MLGIFKSWIWPLYKQHKYDQNQLNVARNRLGMFKTIRNDVSHIKFEQTI